MTFPYELAVFAERNRNRVYDKVIEALENAAAEKGITQAKIAETIGRKRPQVSAWLSGPSNWTLDTVSILLRSVGADMEYTVVFDEDQPKSNVFHPASVQPTAVVIESTALPYFRSISSNPPGSIIASIPSTRFKSIAVE